MSTAQRLQEDYLTCTLCSQPFNHPKALPCMHNYCKPCLSSYLENAMSGGRHSTFNCPDCKKKIYLPDPSKPVARWAAQFPTNFMLSGMVEAIAKERSGTGHGVDMVRAAKERRGRPDIYQEQLNRGSKENSPRNSARLTKTSSFDSGSDVKLHDTQVKLSLLTSTLEQEKQDIKKAKENLIHDLQEQTRKLGKSFERVVELLESRKGQLEDELKASFTEEMERLQQAEQSQRDDLESINSCSELLASLDSEPVSDDVLQDMLEAIKAQTKEIETRPTKVRKRNIRFEQTLEAGRSILKLIDDLGHVTISTEGTNGAEGGQRGASPMLEGTQRGSFDSDRDGNAPGKILAKPKFVNALQAKGSDGKCHQVYDIAVMSNGTLVMTAYGENLVQAARKTSSGYAITARLQLDSEPKCIATMSQYYVAVVGSSCVYIIAAADNNLTLKKTVHTGKDYFGIAAYSESSFILACQKPPSIDFVGLNGFISETIDRDHTTGTLLFKNPQYITSTADGVIFVTDASRVPRVLSVNNAGKLRFQYPQGGSAVLDAPQGVAVDSQGHVYVVDRGARKVVLLTPKGEKIKDLLTQADGVSDPCAICIDKDDNLYVTNDFTEVLIFQTRQ